MADGRRRVVLATRNPGKIAELARILAGVASGGGIGSAAGVASGGGNVEIVGLDAFPDAPDVPETGTTFADNALLKARAIATFTGLPAVSDDSGLAVDALHGMPGVLSARWAGKHGDDEANLNLLLGQLADVAERGAVFVCVAALAVPGDSPAASDDSAPGHGVSGGGVSAGGVSAGGVSAGGVSEADTAMREWTTTGVLAGTLIRARRGANGFGYDPIFVPYGLQRTTAELEPDAKDAISHRGRAFRAIAPIIRAHA